MIIDCISDLHGFYPQLEGGDLLIVAGDLTARDTLEQHLEFAEWFANQKYKHRILIAGNHDNQLVDWVPMKLEEADYLCDSGTEFEYYDPRFPEEDEGFLPSGKRTLKIWGSPWTKTFEGMNPHCKAFTVDTDEELAKKWELIPEDTDILITHSPSYGILDKCFNGNVGSKSLLKCIEKIMPEMVIFGHIHECGGKYIEKEGILYINGSIVDERYRNTNTRRRVIFDEKMPKMQRFKVVE